MTGNRACSSLDLWVRPVMRVYLKGHNLKNVADFLNVFFCSFHLPFSGQSYLEIYTFYSRFDLK